MAHQKREKEETELKVPESLPLCTPPIPVSGATDDPRSNPARSTESSDLKASVNGDDLRSRSSPERSDLIPPAAVEVGRKAVEVNRSLKRPRDDAVRCSCTGCRKKLGLMGFRCRCGDMFCSEHRYSDRHVCSYDYKAAGREAIARENPVVKAAKILKV